MTLQGFEVSKNDLQQVVEVMGDAAGQLADRLHFLRLAQSLFFLLKLQGSFDHLLFERCVEVSQGLLGALALGDLTLRGLGQARVVDCDRSLRGKARETAFRSLREHGGLGVAEEETA
jgi:hypothetical protein